MISLRHFQPWQRSSGADPDRDPSPCPKVDSLNVRKMCHSHNDKKHRKKQPDFYSIYSSPMCDFSQFLTCYIKAATDFFEQMKMYALCRTDIDISFRRFRDLCLVNCLIKHHQRKVGPPKSNKAKKEAVAGNGNGCRLFSELVFSKFTAFEEMSPLHAFCPQDARPFSRYVRNSRVSHLRH